jgi:hypothetical protein
MDTLTIFNAWPQTIFKIKNDNVGENVSYLPLYLKIYGKT